MPGWVKPAGHALPSAQSRSPIRDSLSSYTGISLPIRRGQGQSERKPAALQSQPLQVHHAATPSEPPQRDSLSPCVEGGEG